MVYQNRFTFIQNMDDTLNGTIEGLKPAAWLTRKYHGTAEEALKEAYRASSLVGRVYVVELPLGDIFRQYWPHSTYWFNSLQKPLYGQVIGAFYYPKPKYYVVDVHSIPQQVFEEGESKSEAERNKKEAWDNFQILLKTRAGIASKVESKPKNIIVRSLKFF